MQLYARRPPTGISRQKVCVGTRRQIRHSAKICRSEPALIHGTAHGGASAVPVVWLVFDLALVGLGVFEFVPRRKNLGLAGEVQIANGAGELVR